MKSHRIALAIPIIAAVVIACGGKPPATPTPSSIATPPPSTGTPIAIATPLPSPVPSPVAETTPTTFFLQVLTPQDESVVNTASVAVQGRTVPDAVVTVNGRIVSPNADGTFATVVALEEGPNVIEVVANDFHGHQESKVLTVIYVP